jgi:hypothetical protein
MLFLAQTLHWINKCELIQKLNTSSWISVLGVTTAQVALMAAQQKKRSFQKLLSVVTVDCGLLRCDWIWPCRWLPAFGMSVLPSNFMVEIKPILKMGAICSSETLITTYKITWSHNHSRHFHCRQNLKSLTRQYDSSLRHHQVVIHVEKRLRIEPNMILTHVCTNQCLFSYVSPSDDDRNVKTFSEIFG